MRAASTLSRYKEKRNESRISQNTALDPAKLYFKNISNFPLYDLQEALFFFSNTQESCISLKFKFFNNFMGIGQPARQYISGSLSCRD
jgi:hypothetical protein